jgi:phosphoglycerol transferase MdoB-like AlkP superfamily enzyme
MEDIPGYKKMEQHTMGVHDEYVLNFMQQQLSTLPEPFLAVQYNISTHYPNDVPVNFKKKYAAANITPPMLSMQYYDASLQAFFAKAQQQRWFKNSVFIFCSDHWAQPHEKVINIDKIDALRIPIFIYDPSKEKYPLVIQTRDEISNAQNIFTQLKNLSIFENLNISLISNERNIEYLKKFEGNNVKVYEGFFDTLNKNLSILKWDETFLEDKKDLIFFSLTMITELMVQFFL